MLIDLGYDWSGDPSVPRSLSILPFNPFQNWLEVGVKLVVAAVQGIQAFLADLGVPTAVAPSTTSTPISTLRRRVGATGRSEADGAQLRATELERPRGDTAWPDADVGAGHRHHRAEDAVSGRNVDRLRPSKPRKPKTTSVAGETTETEETSVTEETGEAEETSVTDETRPTETRTTEETTESEETEDSGSTTNETTNNAENNRPTNNDTQNDNAENNDAKTTTDDNANNNANNNDANDQKAAA